MVIKFFGRKMGFKCLVAQKCIMETCARREIVMWLKLGTILIAHSCVACEFCICVVISAVVSASFHLLFDTLSFCSAFYSLVFLF